MRLPCLDVYQGTWERDSDVCQLPLSQAREVERPDRASGLLSLSEVFDFMATLKDRGLAVLVGVGVATKLDFMRAAVIRVYALQGDGMCPQILFPGPRL